MSRLVRVSGLLLILWLASACAPEGYSGTLTANAPDDTPTREIALETPAPTPTQEIVLTLAPADCYELPGAGFTIQTVDPCLDSAPSARGHGQSAPAEWSVVNELETVDGLSGDEFYTDYAPIAPEETGYRFIVEGRAGRWGFSQQVNLEAGCYLAKIAGYVSVVEMSHSGQSNIGAHPYIGEYDLLFAPFPSGRRDFPLFWAVWIPSGQYLFQMLIEARYATALPGTEIIIETVALALDTSGGHCR